jgi:hypothetical protein
LTTALVRRSLRLGTFPCGAGTPPACGGRAVGEASQHGPTIAMTKTYDVASAAMPGTDAPTNPMMIRENSPWR